MLTTFNPVRLSTAENKFLLEHLGQPSVVALRGISGTVNPQAAFPAPGRKADKNPTVYPDGVIPASVKPILDGVYELIEIEKATGQKWIGLEAVKNAIEVWLKQNAKWKFDHERTGGRAPRWPSLYSYDSKGRPHRGGPGSDSGEVKTYFGPAGERIPFEISLMPNTNEEWTGPIQSDAPPEGSHLKVDPTTHRIECRIPLAEGGICGHTESYKPDSRSSYNAARARMSKHLRKATVEVEAHRELHTGEFGN